MFKFSDKNDLMKCENEFGEFLIDFENGDVEIEGKFGDYVVYEDDDCYVLNVDDMFVGMYYDFGDSLGEVVVEKSLEKLLNQLLI